jgi:hypothetical protein
MAAIDLFVTNTAPAVNTSLRAFMVAIVSAKYRVEVITSTFRGNVYRPAKCVVQRQRLAPEQNTKPPVQYSKGFAVRQFVLETLHLHCTNEALQPLPANDCTGRGSHDKNSTSKVTHEIRATRRYLTVKPSV